MKHSKDQMALFCVALSSQQPSVKVEHSPTSSKASAQRLSHAQNMLAHMLSG